MSGTTAAPPSTAPVTRAVAHTLIATALPPSPTSSATRAVTVSVDSDQAARSTSGIGIKLAAAARSELRARFRSWRTAPSVTPSAIAISS